MATETDQAPPSPQELRRKYQELRPDLEEIAAAYADNGLSVLCLHSALYSNPVKCGKVPTYTEWQTRVLSSGELLAEIRKTYRLEGGANIGIKTGKVSNIVCVDCDGPAGRAWFEENKNLLGDYVEAESGKDGIHLFFRYPSSVDFLETRSSKRRVFPGVDILADGQGQAVTWPSIHPKTGRQYTFRRGLNLLDVAHEADELPRWITDEVLAATARDEARRASDDGKEGKPANEYDVEIARAMVRNFPPAIQGQGGDAWTLFVAMRCKDKGLSESQIFEVLRDDFNPRCIPQWSNADLKEKAHNAYKFGRREPGIESITSMFPESVEQLEAATPDEATAPKYMPKYPVVSAQTFLARNPGVTLCDTGQLYRYDPLGFHWRMIEEEQFQSVVMDDIRRADDKVHRSLGMNQLSNTVKAVKRLLEGANPQSGLKPDTWLDGRTGEFVACKNGILDIEHGELLPHSPAWFSFTTLPFPYEREAECPTFEWFLDSIWGADEELKESLRMWIGYVLLSDTREHKFAVFHGESRGGKGTLIKVIEALIGKNNVAACSVAQFGEPFGLEHLLEKRLAVFNDAEKAHGHTVPVATERLKSITAYDNQPVARKNKVNITTRLQVKVILVCNEMPPFLNDRGALTNRMIAFPFTKSFQGKEDHGLLDRLMAELPGILNWALRGSRAFLSGQRLKHSAAGADLVEEFAIQFDTVRSFIRSVVRFTSLPSNVAKSEDCWKAYTEWCRESGIKHPKTRDQFHRAFSGYLKDRAKQVRWPHRGYEGLVLDTSGFPDDLEGHAGAGDLDEPPF